MLPRTGDVLIIGPSASVQFVRPLLFQVIRIHNWSTCLGWVWLDGYELNAAGHPIERRSIFVQIHGLVLKRRGALPANGNDIPRGATWGTDPPPHRESRR